MEGLGALLHFGFEELGLNRMEARCMPVNVASERVVQKLGMQFEGVLREYLRVKGQFCDLKVYSLLKRDCRKTLLGTMISFHVAVTQLSQVIRVGKTPTKESS